MDNPYQAIIFDLYGVLALNGWQAFKAKHFAAREEVWDEVFQLGRQVDAGLADYADLIRYTAEQTGESEATVRYQLEHTAANEELLDFITRELHGKYKLGILSNASSDHVVEQVFTPQQRSLFDIITLSHHVGLTKPDERIYGAIAAKLGVEPERCIYIDDQERHATGAKDAGMHALVYQDVPQLRTELQAL